MLFNSAIFLFFFLPITYVVFWALRTKTTRYVWLTLTGYVFYGWWNPKFCLLMLFSTVVSFCAGLGFLRWGDNPRSRKWLLITPITVDLLLLGFFKYADFGIESWNWVAGWIGRPPLSPLHVLLPVGISFYTFHTISYIIDAYRRDIVPTRNFWEFACYVSLFSQLVAGPIIRFRELQDDLEDIAGKSRRAYLDRGWSFFVIGMVQKVIIADTIAAIIDPALLDVTRLSSMSAWLCMLGYSYQLYFDFAGYSNMAIGLGLLFGMHIPQNFDSPYKALNPSDFWRRWHISLSRCLRDYLYIPLGGSRHGESATYRNLMLTMLLGGLWHGAAWNFVIWGGYHGLLLALYRRYAKIWDAQAVWLQRTAMFLLVVVGWVLFRAPTLGTAMSLLNKMFIPQSGAVLTAGATLITVIGIAAMLAHFGRNTLELTHQWKPSQALGLTVLFVACLIVIYGGNASPYLYFQF